MNERPPVPIEANVIILNQPPHPPLAPRPQGEINLEAREEEDSDCQIVDGPPEGAGPSRVPSPPSGPRGLWRLKKSQGTSVTLQLVPDILQRAPLPREVPPTPQPSPSMENPLKEKCGGKPHNEESGDKGKQE